MLPDITLFEGSPSIPSTLTLLANPGCSSHRNGLSPGYTVLTSAVHGVMQKSCINIRNWMLWAHRIIRCEAGSSQVARLIKF